MVIAVPAESWHNGVRHRGSVPGSSQHPFRSLINSSMCADHKEVRRTHLSGSHSFVCKRFPFSPPVTERRHTHG